MLWDKDSFCFIVKLCKFCTKTYNVEGDEIQFQNFIEDHVSMSVFLVVKLSLKPSLIC